MSGDSSRLGHARSCIPPLKQLLITNWTQALKVVPQSKYFVPEEKFIPLLDDHFGGMAALKASKLESLFTLESVCKAARKQGNSLTSRLIISQGQADAIVFFIQPVWSSLHNVHMLIEKVKKQSIQRFAEQGLKTTMDPSSVIPDFYVVFYPSISPVIETMLERIGLVGILHPIRMAPLPIPIDVDLWSLESLPATTDSSGLFNDAYGTTATIAWTLRNINMLFGSFKSVLAKGEFSVRVLQQFIDLMKTSGSVSSKKSAPDGLRKIDAVLLMDRTIDPLSPALTPQIYEAVVLDHYSGDSAMCGQLKANPEERIKRLQKAQTDTDAAAPPVKPKPITVKFSSLDDPFFPKVQGKTIPEAMSVIKVAIDSTNKQHSEIKNLDITGLHDFVTNKLRDARKMTDSYVNMLDVSTEVITPEVGRVHRFMTELDSMLISRVSKSTVLAKISDLIITGHQPISDVLRRLTIFYVTNPDTFASNADKLRWLFVNSYGFQHAITWNNLISGYLHVYSSGLFKVPSYRVQFDKLLSPKLAGTSPSIADVFDSEFCPPSVKWGERVLFDDSHRNSPLRPFPISFASVAPAVLDALPGPIESAQLPSSPSPHSDRPKTVLIFYVGPVTWQEMAAWRTVARQHDVVIIVATTKISSGRAIFDQFVYQTANRSDSDDNPTDSKHRDDLEYPF